MIYYAAVVTLIFFVRFYFGLQRLGKQPKLIQYYNHKADMVEMIFNMIIAVFGLCLLIGNHMNLI